MCDDVECAFCVMEARYLAPYDRSCYGRCITVILTDSMTTMFAGNLENYSRCGVSAICPG